MTALLLTALAAVVALPLALRRRLMRASLPRVTGTVRVDALSAPVDVVRDEWGVPHIYAATMEDACFAQGWVHAQDRLFQMELNRRVGSGRLAEIFGEAALGADRFVRRIGLRRAAENDAAHLAPEERRVLAAYAAGVNAAVRSGNAKKPLELRLLGVDFEPWSIVDSLVWVKVMSLNLCANFDGELWRARLVEKVGPERAALFELHDPTGLSVVVPSGVKAADPAADLAALYAEAKPYLASGFGAASNNWVVSGRRTKTGKPLLANDPHLPLGIPSIWYEVHLTVAGGLGAPERPQKEDRREPEWATKVRTEQTDVYGVSLPSAPGVVIGHNREVAWGFTNSFADVQDLYLEKRDPARPDYVEWQGQWERAQVVEERIRVKGKPDVIERVTITRHGPIMIDGRNGAPSLALKWIAHEPGHLVGAMLRMNAARDANEFREALREWHSPSQNVVFADTQGNIGYVMAGAVPRRAKGNGFLPVPGWSDEYEWIGTIPFEELPQSWNPESGFVATANNAVVDHRASPHHISWDYMNGYRAERIEELLLAKEKLDANDFRAIQTDTWCRPGKRFAELVAAKKLAPADPVQRAALAALIAWDGNASIDAVAPPIYESMLLFTVRRAFEPELGPELIPELLANQPHPLAPASMLLGRYVRLVLRSLEADDRRVLDVSRRGPGGDPWRDILAGALADACADLATRYGHADVARWHWGTLHRLDLAHPLTVKKFLKIFFPGRNVPIGGDTDTPLQTAFVPSKPFNVSAWAPSWRQIVDLADVRRTRSVFVTGQSGHPASPHWLDQFDLWYHGEDHPQHLDAEDVRRNAEAWLRLVPSASPSR